jgi:hypothetical protein
MVLNNFPKSCSLLPPPLVGKGWVGGMGKSHPPPQPSPTRGREKRQVILHQILTSLTKGCIIDIIDRFDADNAGKIGTDSPFEPHLPSTTSRTMQEMLSREPESRAN